MARLAREVVDRIRALEESLSKTQVQRLVMIVRPCRGALRELMKHLLPRDQLLWDAFKSVEEMSEYTDAYVPFLLRWVASSLMGVLGFRSSTLLCIPTSNILTTLPFAPLWLLSSLFPSPNVILLLSSGDLTWFY